MIFLPTTMMIYYHTNRYGNDDDGLMNRLTVECHRFVVDDVIVVVEEEDATSESRLLAASVPSDIELRKSAVRYSIDLTAISTDHDPTPTPGP
jgi:hypothetical protein